ncbi:MAG: choice-of-anchor B domain-containing protein [Saprospiraceae bacterium]|jgi:choice-of-anchor B domain-containing protein
MKYLFLFTFLFSVLATNSAQKNFNLEVVANVSHDERVNDIWGYVDSAGVEYAIMGSLTRTSIWSLEDPGNPVFLTSFDGPSSIWRDIKSYEDHIYVSAERDKEGILVIDMSLAPDQIAASNFRPFIELGVDADTLNTIHNIFIDEDDGICYLAGSNISNGGVLFFDLKTDKKSPAYIGAQDFDYAHDVFVKNNKMYTSDINSGVFSIYDITDKSLPILLGSEATIMNFSHNAWLSDDENILFTTDERPDAWVESYDVSDPTNITFLDRFQPFETKNTGLIPHNVHYDSGFLVTSWNTDGLVIIDAHDPENLIKVAAYDTELEIESGSGGLWGAFPFLPSGLILGSDRWNGLFVFRPIDNNGEQGYQRASYIEGTVKDAVNGFEIPNVEIKIISDEFVEASTNTIGYYSSGHALEGEYAVQFTKEFYDVLTTTAVFESGEIQILDVELTSIVGIDEILDIDYSISPNPANDHITIDLPSKDFSNMSVEIYNNQGKLVLAQKLINQNNQIDISVFPTGKYMTRLNTDEGYSKTISFIKK